MSGIDRNSPVWKAVERTINTRLVELGRMLEDPLMEDRETQVIRGEIRALKRLLVVGRPSKFAEQGA